MASRMYANPCWGVGVGRLFWKYQRHLLNLLDIFCVQIIAIVLPFVRNALFVPFKFIECIGWQLLNLPYALNTAYWGFSALSLSFQVVIVGPEMC